MSTFQQFVVFGTDNVGLERLLRLLQSLAQILLHYPLLLTTFHSLLTSLPIPSAAEKATEFTPETLSLNLTLARTTFNITRRYLRLFRFLDSFSTAQSLYLSPSSSSSYGTSLDVLRGTLFGMYGLLETLTVLDVSGISVFGAETTRWMNFEAQRFWLGALLCGVVSGVGKMVTGYAYRSVPETGDGFGTEKEDKEGKEKREAVREKKEAERIAKSRAVMRKLVADLLDLVLPGTVVGWVKADPGVVGLAMLGSSLLTGYDVWLRCGKQVSR